MINTRAAGDSRFARTGKDGAIYNADGVLLATVDSFTANVTYNNAAYSVLGNAQELETANTFKVALTMSQVVVEDEFYKKPHGVQAFMLASMRIYLESSKGGEDDGGNNTN